MKVVAIDGPSGVGKSSVARLMAERLGYYFLSSGLIYRCIAWYLLGEGWTAGTAPDTARLADFALSIGPDGVPSVNGTPIREGLHTDAISHAASVVSTDPAIRAVADRAQRETARKLARSGAFPGMVIEGRDSGTVVFPDADHKFFITASDTVRAHRRFLELKAADPAVTEEAVLAALRERDRRDTTRDHAPLKPAPDAVLVDTSELTLEQVLATILARVAPADA